MSSDRQIQLICSPPMRKLGERVVELYEEVALAEVVWTFFPDGYPNLFIKDVHDVCFLFLFIFFFPSPSLLCISL